MDWEDVLCGVYKDPPPRAAGEMVELFMWGYN